MTKDPKKVEAGRKGGQATYNTHGSDHMSRIGTKGAETTWERHTIKPVNQSQYAMVRKADNIIVAIIGYRGD